MEIELQKWRVHPPVLHTSSGQKLDGGKT